MSMDREVISSFAKATIETFSTMMQTKVTPKQARTKEERIPGDGVHAIIGMTGTVEGAIALTLPTETSLTVVSCMIGEELTELDISIVDGVQEINNVIIGAAKKHLSQAGIDFVFGLPKTMVGTMFATDEGVGFRNLGIRFSSDMGGFLVNLSWRVTQK